MNDDIDQIMAVMDAAFDPHFGEAWNRRQVTDALLMGNCRYILAGKSGKALRSGENAAGFTLSRKAADEEELLLIAVIPECRNMGIGASLLNLMSVKAKTDNVANIFLEMREDNQAEQLYLRNGFRPIGRRRDYYKFKDGTKADAITFSKSL